MKKKVVLIVEIPESVDDGMSGEDWMDVRLSEWSEAGFKIEEFVGHASPAAYEKK